MHEETFAPETQPAVHAAHDDTAPASVPCEETPLPETPSSETAQGEAPCEQSGDGSFLMEPQQRGRLKYLLLTLVAPTVVSYVPVLLRMWGVKSLPNALGPIVSGLMLVAVLVLAYFLIFRKSHSLAVGAGEISERSLLSGKILRTVSAEEICSVRHNLLGEWLLQDGQGKTLLCVESNMSCREELAAWLAKRGRTVE